MCEQRRRARATPSPRTTCARRRRAPRGAARRGGVGRATARGRRRADHDAARRRAGRGRPARARRRARALKPGARRDRHEHELGRARPADRGGRRRARRRRARRAGRRRAAGARRASCTIFVGGDAADVRPRPSGPGGDGRPGASSTSARTARATRSSCSSTCSGSSTPPRRPRRSSWASAPGIDVRTLHTASRRRPARSSFLDHEALEVLRTASTASASRSASSTKDLRLALDAGEESRSPRRVSARTRELYDAGAGAVRRRRPARWRVLALLRAARRRTPLRFPPSRSMLGEAPAHPAAPGRSFRRGRGRGSLPRARSGRAPPSSSRIPASWPPGVAARRAVRCAARRRADASSSTASARTRPSPPYRTGRRGAARASGRRAVVAIGGGSPIDAAKAIVLRAARPAAPDPPIVGRPDDAPAPEPRRTAFGVIERRRRAPQALHRPPVDAAAPRGARPAARPSAPRPA